MELKKRTLELEPKTVVFVRMDPTILAKVKELAKRARTGIPP